MLFLGIDLHLRQMTISLRNQGGDVLLRRQVSTRWPKLEEFREQLRQVAAGDEKYVAILEVCGFHDWLVKWLHQDARCQLVLVVQPLGRSATKTDRRDAHALSELLWINRERLLRGDRVHGMRTVHVPGEEQMADRRLTSMRERLVRRRTQTINQIHKILRRQNREWDRPTKTFQTQKVAAWLTRLELEPMDRLLLNQLLVQWQLWEEQIVKVDAQIAQRWLTNRRRPTAGYHPRREYVYRPGDRQPSGADGTVPAWSEPGEFPGSDPGLPQFGRDGADGVDHEDGEPTGTFPAGPGGPASASVAMGRVRAWYQRIKRRRGTNIARVALMRRTVTIMWRMLTTREAWRPGSANAGAEAAEVPRKVRPRRGRRTVWSALSQAAPHAESTGSSSLLTSEEVTPCQA